MHDFLALVEAITGRASDLVGGLVPIAAVPTLYEKHLQRAARKRLAFDAPWSEAVLRVMETSGYRSDAHNQPGYIARRLGLTLQQEQELLRSLEAGGILRKRAGRYLDLAPLSVDTASASAEDVARLKAHWTHVCLDRVLAPRTCALLGFRSRTRAAR